LKPINKPTPTFFLTLAAFASLSVPGTGSSLMLPAASITTSLDQCESQVCGSLPPLASYSGLLSGFPGMQAVGEGANVTATGYAAPALTSQVPLAGANALMAAELTYYLEVVPVDGDPTVAPVQIGVNAVGYTSTATVSGSSGVSNEASTNITLALLSGSSGTAVFSDTVNIVYDALLSGTCFTSNTSSATGAGVVPTGTVSCGSSSMSGGFTENGSYTISTNSPYEVAMIANIQIGTSNDGDANGPGSVMGTAFVDPIFSVGAGYELVLSAGVGNTASATPEPGTWTMLAAGLGLLGAANLRRVNRATRASAPKR
jgi:hypothetical protein